jgi:DNA-binding transcriptional MerR regulator
MDKEILSFFEMCAHFVVTPRTFRYFVYIVVLQPERDGRSRFYSSRDVARMTLIMRGRRFGFSLEELRQWLMIYDKEGNKAQMQAWVPIARGKLVELQKQQKEISEAVSELSEMIDSVSSDLDQT